MHASLISFATGHAASKILDRIAEKFHTHVIERWSKHRAQIFFQAFCLQIAKEKKGMSTGVVENLLSEILENEAYSEILFESYRRVTLSRSREIGPRIIGVLTAQLVVADRSATDDEEIMFSVAEQLNDDELIHFCDFVKEKKKDTLNYNPDRRGADHQTHFDKSGMLKIYHNHEQIDSGWPRDIEMSISAINLGQELGGWAVKLKQLNVVIDEIIEKQWDYKEDSERHVDQDGTIRQLTWWIMIPESFLGLADLIDRFK